MVKVRRAGSHKGFPELANLFKACISSRGSQLRNAVQVNEMAMRGLSKEVEQRFETSKYENYLTFEIALRIFLCTTPLKAEEKSGLITPVPYFSANRRSEPLRNPGFRAG